MAQAAMLSVDAYDARAIDRPHLRQMTFGDGNLERELLQLFDRQSELLIERMRAGDVAILAALAHPLKASVAGIGAGAVARAAEAAERAAVGSAAERAAALDGLSAIDAARAEIAALLAG